MSKAAAGPGSGAKYCSPRGVPAIKDGIKPNAHRRIPAGRKPPWLRIRLVPGTGVSAGSGAETGNGAGNSAGSGAVRGPGAEIGAGNDAGSGSGNSAARNGAGSGAGNRAGRGPGSKEQAKFNAVRQAVREGNLATVCEESHCPNIGECWSRGTATLMLMGSICTRACRFCAVDTGNPGGWLDAAEPANAARAVAAMGLRYVVLTSVDRDDLPDGGAGHYAACVAAIRARNPATAVEALTPDFGGDLAAVAMVARSGVKVFAQNLETVERLTRRVRDPRAGYQSTLDVLEHAKQAAPGVLTKSSLMLGLGEQEAEVTQAMRDLRDAGADILTLGQYLRPTPNHLPVEEYVHPRRFDAYRAEALAMGFAEVAAGPLVRSSYRAEWILERGMLSPADSTAGRALVSSTALSAAWKAPHGGSDYAPDEAAIRVVNLD